jgi:cytochrome P450
VKTFNPFESQMYADPYPTYAWYREAEPVHWGVAGDPNFAGNWYLFRHGDVVAALGDLRLGREVRRVLPEGALPPPPEAYRPLFQTAEKWMILRDPPTHTHLRSLVQKAFTPRMVRRVLPRVEALAEGLIDRFADTGRADLIADFARLLPVLVIAEILGIPPEDYPIFLPWVVTLASTIEFRQAEEVYRRGSEAMASLTGYLRDLIASRRDRPSDDLIGALLSVEQDGRRLAEDDVLGNITLLLTAGNDPTMHLIGNSVVTLLRHPDQLERLRREPALIETAVDELLRYDSAVQMTFRYALQDVQYGNRMLRTGEQVAIVFGSPLRDPAYCADPDVLDLARENNRLPFGLGIHFCLGSALARLEGQIALSRLLNRLPNLRLADQQVEWQETVAVHGLKALKVEFST